MASKLVGCHLYLKHLVLLIGCSYVLLIVHLCITTDPMSAIWSLMTVFQNSDVTVVYDGKEVTNKMLNPYKSAVQSVSRMPIPALHEYTLLSASLYVSKRGAY